MENLAYKEPPVTELIEGKTYLMSPRPRLQHNFVASNIYHIFATYLHGKTCKAIADGTDLFLDKENHYVPDTMIVCDRSKLKSDGVHGAPDLVVEVLSPSTAQNDRGAKMRHYAAAGVKEYWIV
ncbi:MAG: Uma2 family endonuclease, partial [Veillonellaceae bacterium]|nr:Uma2 family endonuclease [Veillonellaceae bacterium]